MSNEIPAKFCPGCGHPVVLFNLKRVLSENNELDKAVLGLDIGCSLLAWNFLPINTFQTHHGRVTPTMVGFKRARPESLAVAYAGDGGAYAIGWQSLYHAARRDEPISVFVVNNTVYGMTGGQTAPTTLVGQVTPTSPEGNEDLPFLGPENLRLVANENAYLARTAVNTPEDLFNCIKKSLATQKSGHFSLVEFLSYCPTNWHTKGTATNDYLEKMKETFKLGEF